MSDRSPKDGVANTELSQLTAKLNGIAGLLYAVVDGGLIEDAATRLSQIGLFGRSLFLGAGQDIEAAGPILVSLGSESSKIEPLLSFVNDRPAVVWWHSNVGEETIWRHLRTLNQARIPRPPPAEGTDPQSMEPASPQTETVLFRHWDPRVLGATVPLLTASQTSRLLGPAEEVCFLDSRIAGGLGIGSITRPHSSPDPERGMLSLTGAQMERLDAEMLVRSRRRVAGYLRDVAPELTARLSDDGMNRRVEYAELSGQALGLVSERAQMKWAYLMLITKGEAEGDPTISAFIRGDGRHADRQVDEVMRQLIGASSQVGEMKL